MKNLFFLCLVFFSFSSCSLIYIDSDETKSVVQKTTIKDIAKCSEPIVITMPVFKYSYLFGIKGDSYRQSRLGDIFVVIDTQTNDLYDWVYFADSEGSVIWRCVELGENPKKYFASSKSGIQSFIQAGKTSVTQHKTDCYGSYMANYSSRGKYGLLVDFGYDREQELSVYRMAVFNSEDGSVNQNKLYLYNDSIGAITQPIADETGNFYLAYAIKEFSYIAKIDVENNSLHTLNKKYQNEIDVNNGYREKTYHIEGVYDGKIFCERNLTGDYRIKDLYEFYVLDESNLENEKIFKMPSTLVDNQEYAPFFYTGVYYKNKFYAILPDSNKDWFYILEIDQTQADGEATLFIEEPIEFDLTENVWLRGSRLYVMSSRNTSNVKFMYIDLETKEQSHIFNLKYDDIIER